MILLILILILVIIIFSVMSSSKKESQSSPVNNKTNETHKKENITSLPELGLHFWGDETDEKEIMEYLTSVMRKEAITTVSVIDYKTGTAFHVERTPTEREALHAAEDLAKIYKIDNLRTPTQPVVVIRGYDEIYD